MRTLEINGVEYPIHFGAAALNSFCIKFNIPSIGELIQRVIDVIPRSADGTHISDEAEVNNIIPQQVDVPFSLAELAGIIHFGINDGYRKAGSPERISAEEAFDLMDEKQGLAMEAAAIFVQSVVSLVSTEEKKAKAGPRKAASPLRN